MMNLSTKKIKLVYPSVKCPDLKTAVINAKCIHDLTKYINPSIQDIHDPFMIYGIEEAVKVILNHIKCGNKIYIHGDFDVDGICATSLLWDYLYNYLGADVLPFVPNRFSEGYGLSENSIKKIIESGAKLIITVDCGIKDIDLISKYYKNLDFVITDHHTLQTIEFLDENFKSSVDIVNSFVIPKHASAVVHPKISTDVEICGSFVAWDLVRALHDITNKGDPEKYLEFVALGTVCDVMPLVDDNRTIVKLGLNKIKITQNLGVQYLFEIADIELRDVTVYHLGFVIGPMLNASGRLDSAMDAVRLLCTKDKRIAYKLAKKLHLLNIQRQELTKNLLIVADSLLSAQQDNIVKFVYGEDWPEGIVGLVAGKLTEKYQQPIIVGSLKDGLIKASARSIESINITQQLKNLSYLLERFGGHSLAAGFTIHQSNVENFMDQLQNNLIKQNIVLPDEILVNIDHILSEKDITIENVNFLESLEPFGYGNKVPNFYYSLPAKFAPKFVGKKNNHIKFSIRNNFDLIGFDQADEFRELGEGLSGFVINLTKNNWNQSTTIIGKIKYLV